MSDLVFCPACGSDQPSTHGHGYRITPDAGGELSFQFFVADGGRASVSLFGGGLPLMALNWEQLRRIRGWIDANDPEARLTEWRVETPPRTPGGGASMSRAIGPWRESVREARQDVERATTRIILPPADVRPSEVFTADAVEAAKGRTNCGTCGRVFPGATDVAICRCDGTFLTETGVRPNEAKPDNLCTWCRRPMEGHPMSSCIGEECEHKSRNRAGWCPDCGRWFNGLEWLRPTGVVTEQRTDKLTGRADEIKVRLGTAERPGSDLERIAREWLSDTFADDNPRASTLTSLVKLLAEVDMNAGKREVAVYLLTRDAAAAKATK